MTGLTTSKRPLRVSATGLMLMVALLACNASVPGSSPEDPEETPTTEGTPVSVVIPTTTPPPPTEAPTNTPEPTAIPTEEPTEEPTQGSGGGGGGGGLNADFGGDITVPDGTKFKPGEKFDKIWRLRNNGSVAWPSGTVLAFISGNQMGGPASVTVPTTAPGATADVKVSMTAPTQNGSHKGFWQLKTSDGKTFGAQVYIEIVVQEGAAPTNTPGGPTNTPAPTQGIELIVSELVVTGNSYVGETENVRVVVQNKGSNEAGASKLRVRVTDKSDRFFDIPAIPSGQTREVTLEVLFDKKQTYQVLASADIDNTVSEADEGNNSAAVDVTVRDTATLKHSGTITLAEGRCVEFSTGDGDESCGGSENDFRYKKDGDKRELVKENNGAFLFIVGFTKPPLYQCASFSYGENQAKININDLSVGTYVCFITNSNPPGPQMYGYFKVVEKKDTEIKLEYKSYQIK